MVLYDECDSMRLYAMVRDSNAMVWDSNDILWDFNAMVYDVKDMLKLTVLSKLETCKILPLVYSRSFSKYSY